jgi:hypothetical protein
MKRTVIVLSTLLIVFVAVFAVLVLRPVRKVKASRGCSNASLKGNYSVVMPGYYTEEAVVAEWDFSTLASFDGQGNVSGSNLFGTYDGENWGGGPESFTGGWYTVYPDCSVAITLPEGLGVFDTDYYVYLTGFVSDTGGDEASGTGFFDVPWTGTWSAKKIREGRWNYFE